MKTFSQFELNESTEAKVVNALDKLECKLQHIEADLSTWNQKELDLSFDWEESLYDVDDVILELSQELKRLSLCKVRGDSVALS